MTNNTHVERCTQDQFENLHESLDKVKSTSTTVKVSKDALRNLLMDHAMLIDRKARP